jgi:peptidoglycan hydrolase-like protein with peptidoglycan-binding domain
MTSTLQFDHLNRYIPGASLGDIQNGEAGIALSNGAKGDDVTTVQRLLNAVRDPTTQPLKADDFYGQKTSGRVAEFQAANGLTADGRTDDKTLAALTKKFQQLNGLPQTGLVDQPTLDLLGQKTNTKPRVAPEAPAPAPVTPQAVAATPTTEQIANGPADGQTRPTTTDPKMMRYTLDQALNSNPTADDIRSARADRAQLKVLQGQLDDYNNTAYTTPEQDRQADAIQKQITAISQRLGTSVAGQDYAVLDQQRAADAALQPGFWNGVGDFFRGTAQPRISAEAAAARNVDLLSGKLGEPTPTPSAAPAPTKTDVASAIADAYANGTFIAP